MEKNNNNNKINRRDFFKLAGAGTLASATALYGCSGQKNSSDSESAASGEIPTDKMVYRTNPTTGDRVSILGYGCMRWPTPGNGQTETAMRWIRKPSTNWLTMPLPMA